MSKLALVRRLILALGGELTIGTCRTCHGLVDLDAVEAHEWWHKQQEKEPEVVIHRHEKPTYETRPIKIGRHML